MREKILITFFVMAGVICLPAIKIFAADKSLIQDPKLSPRDINLRGGAIMTTATQASLTCDAFQNGEKIPLKYTGDGQDISPALSWTGLPQATKEIAIIVDDPDAPAKEPWVHWLIYKIPASAKSLPENIPAKETLSDPPGALQGKNSFGKIGYGGPLPPKGHGIHHYHFMLFALDEPLSVKAGISKKQLQEAMDGHVLAQGEIVGIYSR